MASFSSVKSVGSSKSPWILDAERTATAAGGMNTSDLWPAKQGEISGSALSLPPSLLLISDSWTLYASPTVCVLQIETQGDQMQVKLPANWHRILLLESDHQ